MSLVLVEGFDHLSISDINRKGWSGSPFAISTGRVGGSSINVIPNNSVQKFLPSTYSALVAGFGLRTFNYFGPAFHLDGCGVTFDDSGHFAISDITGALVAVGTTPVDLGVWNYLEIKVNYSTGDAELRLNGVTEASCSGQDFGASGGLISLSSSFGGPSFGKDFDDIYVGDVSTGSDFLGDVIVETLYPRADGTYSEWTPDTGTDHYAMVDEHTADGDSSLIVASAANDRDTFFLDPVTATVTTIFGAQLSVVARKSDGSTRQIAPMIRQASTDHVGSTFTLSTDFTVDTWILDKDPTGTDWTPATINADEFGVKRIA